MMTTVAGTWKGVASNRGRLTPHQPCPATGHVGNPAIGNATGHLRNHASIPARVCGELLPVEVALTMYKPRAAL